MRSKLAGVALLCGLLFWGVLPLAAQELEFVRGDVNQDGLVDLSDPISVLFHLFVPGHQAQCERAADINDDGSVQIADAVYALQYLFAGGPSPFAPFPYCGDDPTPDGLGCGDTLCGLGTPEVVLSAHCTADPEVELAWEINNLETWTVNLDWELAGTAQGGTLSIPPVGTVVHTTPRVPGVNKLVLYYVGEEVGRVAQVRVIISEIMASNALSLDDEDGDSSDWIEIHLVSDPCTPSVDLENWCLTDDPAELTRWRFPKVTLEAGGYVLIFASGKDRKVEASELHTNFALAEEGEYLALVAEDGVTVVDEFEPSYPEQLTDVSYGLAQSTTVFVAEGSQALYHVPTSADAGLGSDWANVDYAPSGWQTGATGLGFSGIATEGFQVTYIKANVLVDYLTDAQDVLNDPAKQTTVVTDTAAFIDFLNTGGSGNYRNDLPFPGLGSTDAVDDYVVHVTGTVLIPATGQWSFGVNSDDGFGLSITNGYQTFHMEYPGPRGPRDTIQVFDFTQAGPYEVDLLFYERGGGAELEFFAAQGSHTSFGYDYFDLVGDTANGGLSLLGFASDVETDVGEEMRDINASIWVRMGFNVDDASAFGGLMLRMKYEDGFVAYLNGQEVASRNAPAQLTWDSQASSDRPVEDVPVFEEINLAAYVHLLQDGPNVLAIHGLNDAASDGDFLILPELVSASKVSEVNYMEVPTPGAFNASGTVDFVRAVEFNPKRGFYESPFYLSLSTPTSGSQIRYTLDGSTPTSTTGTAYTTPITVSKTSVIRARAFKPDYLDSRVTTNSYIFVNDVIRQSPNGEAPGPGWPTGRVNGQILDYGMDPDIVNNAKWSGLIVEALLDIPMISLVTDLGNLFDPATGIYVNATNDGRAWERPTSAELIYPDGTEGFGVDAGLRIRGAVSRGDSNPKHALRLFFRSEYGPGKLAYPLFGGEGVDEFDKVDLRTSQNYSWAFEGSTQNTFLREVFSRDVQRDMRRPYTRSRYYHLYINGHYWGLYQTQERADADYASSYLHGLPSEYDSIKNDSSGSRALHAADGTMDAYQRLYNAAVTGFAPAQAYLAVLGLKPDGTPDPDGERLLDPVNVMDYMICTYYTGDPDAPVSCWGHFSNNVFAIYNRVHPKGFTWYRHDAEHSLGANGGLNEGRLLTDPTDKNIGQEWRHFNPAWLHRRLTANQEYLIQFADRVNKYFSNGGILSSQPNIDRWLARADQIDLAIIAESARWGDAKTNPPCTKDDWQAQVNYMVNTYFPQRTQIVIGQMRSQSMFPQLATVSFNQHGGEVAPGFELTMSQGNGTAGAIYYTVDGSDPRLEGGGINPAAAVFEGAPSPPVILSETTTVKARVYGGGQWGAATSARFTVGLKGLVINEIMASNHLTLEDPDEPGEFPDWIEIYNGTAATINLDGMYLTDDLQDLTKWRIDSTKWEDPPDLTIPANGYLIFYADDDGTQGAYHTNYKLGRGGDSVTLVDVEGETIIDSIIFDFQVDDVSYGRFPDGGVAWGFHQAASPGSANFPHTP